MPTARLLAHLGWRGGLLSRYTAFGGIRHFHIIRCFRSCFAHGWSAFLRCVFAREMDWLDGAKLGRSAVIAVSAGAVGGYGSKWRKMSSRRGRRDHRPIRSWYQLKSNRTNDQIVFETSNHSRAQKGLCLVRTDLPWVRRPHFSYRSGTLVLSTWVPHTHFSVIKFLHQRDILFYLVHVHSNCPI